MTRSASRSAIVTGDRSAFRSTAGPARNHWSVTAPAASAISTASVRSSRHSSAIPLPRSLISGL